MRRLASIAIAPITVLALALPTVFAGSAAATTAATPTPTPFSAYNGVWHSVGADTSLAKLRIRKVNGQIRVHVWGQCVTLCDWGVANAKAFALQPYFGGDGVQAIQASFGSASGVETLLITPTKAGGLRVQMLTDYWDTRADAYSVDFFKR